VSGSVPCARCPGVSAFASCLASAGAVRLRRVFRQRSLVAATAPLPGAVIAGPSGPSRPPMEAGSVASSGHRGGRLGSGERPNYDTPRQVVSQAQNTRCSGCPDHRTATYSGSAAFGHHVARPSIVPCGAECGPLRGSCGEVAPGGGPHVDNPAPASPPRRSGPHDIEHPRGLVAKLAREEQ
jgi:hypothetical protein